MRRRHRPRQGSAERTLLNAMIVREAAAVEKCGQLRAELQALRAAHREAIVEIQRLYLELADARVDLDHDPLGSGAYEPRQHTGGPL